MCACGGAERIFTFSGEIWFGFGAEKGPSKLAMGGNAGVARSFFFLLFLLFLLPRRPSPMMLTVLGGRVAAALFAEFYFVFFSSISCSLTFMLEARANYLCQSQLSIYFDYFCLKILVSLKRSEN